MDLRYFFAQKIEGVYKMEEVQKNKMAEVLTSIISVFILKKKYKEKIAVLEEK